jgi:hypothetical protein
VFLLSCVAKMGTRRPLKRILLWVIVIEVLLVGFVLYRSRSKGNLSVDPHAREEIEKAKRR